MGPSAVATHQFWPESLDSCILQSSRRQRLSWRESMEQNDWRSKSNWLRAEAYRLRPAAPDTRPPSWDAVASTLQHKPSCFFFICLLFFNTIMNSWIESTSFHTIDTFLHWCFLVGLALFGISTTVRPVVAFSQLRDSSQIYTTIDKHMTQRVRAADERKRNLLILSSRFSPASPGHSSALICPSAQHLTQQTDDSV